MKIPKWAIEKLSLPAHDYFGSGWDAQDFLNHLPETIELNKIYLFGFERRFLCKVASIEPFKYTNGDGTELFDVELELILDLDEVDIEFESIKLDIDVSHRGELEEWVEKEYEGVELKFANPHITRLQIENHRLRNLVSACEAFVQNLQRG